MKKILFLYAFAAIVFCLASCEGKTKEPDSQPQEQTDPQPEPEPQPEPLRYLNRFNISVANITEKSAHFVITPPDEQMSYLYMFTTLGTFKAFQSQSDEMEKFFKFGGCNLATGTYEDDKEELMPSNKFVLCVVELNAENEGLVGEVEYIQFETPTIEPELADFTDSKMTALPLTGTVGFSGDDKSALWISGSYSMDEETRLGIQLIYYSKKATGHFTTDDMITFFLIFSAIYEDDNDDTNGVPFANMNVVYASDVTGTYNASTGKYEYSGWCDAILDKSAVRIPFTMECDLLEAEEEETSNAIMKRLKNNLQLLNSK